MDPTSFQFHASMLLKSSVQLLFTWRTAKPIHCSKLRTYLLVQHEIEVHSWKWVEAKKRIGCLSANLFEGSCNEAPFLLCPITLCLENPWTNSFGESYIRPSCVLGCWKIVGKCKLHSSVDKPLIRCFQTKDWRHDFGAISEENYGLLMTL